MIVLCVSQSRSGDLTIDTATTIDHVLLTDYSGDITLEDNWTISGTMDISGTLTGDGYAYISSVVRGTQRTITVNGSIAYTSGYVGFEDIIGAGTASWDLSDTDKDMADWGGNSGITFPTAVNVYRHQGTTDTTASNEAMWFMDTEGMVQGTLLPMGQHIGVFGTFSMDAIGVTYTHDYERMGGVNYEYMTRKPDNEWNASNSYFYGDYILNERLTGTDYVNGGFAWRADGNKVMRGRGTHTIDWQGTTFNGNSSGALIIDAINGTYVTPLGATYSGGENESFIVTSGTLKFGLDNQAQVRSLKSDSGENRSIILQDTKLIVESWDFSDTTNLTFTAGDSTVVAYNCGATWDFGDGVTFNNFIISDAGDDCVTGTTGTLTVTGTNTFNDLLIRAGRAITFADGTTQTINGKLETASKRSDNNRDRLSYRYVNEGTTLTTGISSSGTATISLSECPDMDFVRISNTTCTPSQYCYAGRNSIDNGGNSGWTFEDCPSTVGVKF